MPLALGLARTPAREGAALAATTTGTGLWLATSWPGGSGSWSRWLADALPVLMGLGCAALALLAYQGAAAVARGTTAR